MTRETKAGLLMILMLAGVFGFMVYKRMHQPAEVLAQQNPPASPEQNGQEQAGTEQGGQEADGMEPGDPDAGGQETESVATNAASPASANPFDIDDPATVETLPETADGFDSPGDSDLAAKPNTLPPRAMPRLPTDIEETSPDQTDPFATPETAQSTAPLAAASRELPDVDVEEEANPFDPKPARALASRKPTHVHASERHAEFVDEQPSFEAPDRTLAAPARPQELPSTDEAFPKPTRPSIGLSPPSNIQQSSIEFSPAEPAQPAAENDPFGANTELKVQAPPKRSANEFAEDSSAAIEPPATSATGVQESENPFDSAPAQAPSVSAPETRLPASKPTANSATDDPFGGYQPAQTGTPAANAFGDDDRRSAPMIQQVPRRSAVPAPVTQIDDDFGDRPTGRPLIAGDTYQIEHGDNFWTISRKKYGVGKYFMALAEHNSQVIPDPRRMKLGATISTPAAELLERSYPQLIPKPAPADPIQTASASPGTIKTAAAAPADSDAEAGFFVAADGTPMYRVAREDTLSGIAQRHLGRSSRWMQVYELNRDVLTDGNTLKIGAILRLPADASRVDVVGNARTFR
ncbi:MAG: LysM peptidoglycan-binding domain-containing protein [Planctomycetes bacterium]|nr:LysM peptidoglycan-binding domain-containing protein [Planctomycetota bacterium]